MQKIAPKGSVKCLLSLFLLAWTYNDFAQQLPNDVGTTVSGFQDDFDGTVLNTNWAIAGANVFSVSAGVLHVASATGDPNHLLYEARDGIF